MKVKAKFSLIQFAFVLSLCHRIYIHFSLPLSIHMHVKPWNCSWSFFKQEVLLISLSIWIILILCVYTASLPFYLSLHVHARFLCVCVCALHPSLFFAICSPFISELACLFCLYNYSFMPVYPAAPLFLLPSSVYSSLSYDSPLIWLTQFLYINLSAIIPCLACPRTQGRIHLSNLASICQKYRDLACVLCHIEICQT